MKIVKEAKTGEIAMISAEDMELINKFSKKKLTNDDDYRKQKKKIPVSVVGPV